MDRGKKIKILSVRFIRDLFAAASVLFFVLLVLEDAKPGFASSVMDLRIILAIWAGSGAVSLFTSGFFSKNRPDVDNRFDKISRLANIKERR